MNILQRIVFSVGCLLWACHAMPSVQQNQDQIEGHREDNVIYKYRNRFFMGNRSTDVQNFGNFVPSPDECRSMEFTDVYREKGCYPIYVRNRMCVGFCNSVSFPAQNQRYPQNSWQCSACRPREFETRDVYMLCRFKNKKGAKNSNGKNVGAKNNNNNKNGRPARRFKVIKRKYRAVKSCQCQTYQCAESKAKKFVEHTN